MRFSQLTFLQFPTQNPPIELVPFRLLITTWCHFVYLLPLGAISPTRAKWDQINVKQLKQAVQAYKVMGIVQKRNKMK